MNQLAGHLGSEEHDLFLQYENAANSLMNRGDELIYQQGLIDGLRLGYLLDKIRQGN